MTQTAGEDAQLRKMLIQSETAVWEALVQGDIEADARALHDAFLGVYTDGFSQKTDHMSQLADGPIVVSYDLSEFKVLVLGPDCALLSYRADYLPVDAGERERMYVSSIWRNTPAGWLNIFSQDTPAQNDEKS